MYNNTENVKGEIMMKNFKRLIVSFVMVITLLAVVPTVAHAEWRQSVNGWWYSQVGSSYALGWTQIDGKWYYFDPNGYMKTGWINDGGNWFYTYGDGIMAHDTTIDGCYLSSSGAWTTSIPTQNTTTSSINSSNSKQYMDANGNGLIKGSKSHIYHVPGSKYYDKTTNIVQWFNTIEEAEAAGYRAPKKQRNDNKNRGSIYNKH